MSSSIPPRQLPLELWAQIMNHCSNDIKTLKALAHISHSCREEVHKRLFHTVIFAEGSLWHPRVHIKGTSIRDLALFYATLKSESFNWRELIHNAYLCWSNQGVLQTWSTGYRIHGEPWDNPRPVDMECFYRHSYFNDLIRDTAILLSEASSLKILHLSLPNLYSKVPFEIPGLTSLTVPITGCMHDEPDWPRIFKLFQIPSLRHMELHSMVRLRHMDHERRNLPFVPERFCQSGISNITHLTFTDCGPPCGDMMPILAWPKNLQSLKLEVDMPQGLNRFAYSSGDFSPNGFLRALQPTRHSLQSLDFTFISHADEWASESLLQGAFQHFTSLRRLSIPLELIWQFSDEDLHDHPGEIAPPLHSSLPDSLQELTLEIYSQLDFVADFDGYTPEGDPDKEAVEVMDELYGLVVRKPERFTRLREINITGTCLDDYWIFLEDCRKILRRNPLFERRDVSVNFVCG